MFFWGVHLPWLPDPKRAESIFFKAMKTTFLAKIHGNSWASQQENTSFNERVFPK